jgi:hypothetical protein
MALAPAPLRTRLLCLAHWRLTQPHAQPHAAALEAAGEGSVTRGGHPSQSDDLPGGRWATTYFSYLLTTGKIFICEILL